MAIQIIAITIMFSATLPACSQAIIPLMFPSSFRSFPPQQMQSIGSQRDHCQVQRDPRPCREVFQ